MSGNLRASTAAASTSPACLRQSSAGYHPSELSPSAGPSAPPGGPTPTSSPSSRVEVGIDEPSGASPFARVQEVLPLPLNPNPTSSPHPRPRPLRTPENLTLALAITLTLTLTRALTLTLTRPAAAPRARGSTPSSVSARARCPQRRAQRPWCRRRSQGGLRCRKGGRS